MTDARSSEVLGNQVIKFSPDGAIMMTLTHAGSDSEPLHWPNDVVVDPSDGDIFVAESHRGGRNNRIVHFDRQGRFIKTIGSAGSAPGQLREPHSLALDSRGRLFVGDRENNRIQIFPRAGCYLMSGPNLVVPAACSSLRTTGFMWQIPNRAGHRRRRADRHHERDSNRFCH